MQQKNISHEKNTCNDNDIVKYNLFFCLLHIPPLILFLSYQLQPNIKHFSLSAATTSMCLSFFFLFNFSCLEDLLLSIFTKNWIQVLLKFFKDNVDIFFFVLNLLYCRHSTSYFSFQEHIIIQFWNYVLCLYFSH